MTEQERSELKEIVDKMKEDARVSQENEESYNRGFRDGVRAALELRRS